MMLETYEKNSKKKLIATVVAMIVIAGVVVLANVFKSKNSSSASTASQGTSQVASDSTATNAADTATTDATASGTSKDGTYSDSEDYDVPAGTESIKVSLTLSGGTVTDVSIVNSESDHDSADYQQEFTSSYKSSVVGKSISGLQISSIAGASDTTAAFNQALTKIASQAQA